MRTPLRFACLVFVVFAFVAGCGDDDASETPPTSAFNPSATTALSASTTAVATPTSTVGGVVQNVTDGAPCTPQGARGQTRGGMAMICATTGGELRWRPA